MKMALQEEYARISRELHDEVGQALTSLSVGLEVLRISSSPEESRRLIDRLILVVKRATQTVSSIARGLDPPLIAGLASALQDLAEEHALLHSTEVTVYMARVIDERNLDERSAFAAYHCVQEALHNVAKHAPASSVQIRVDPTPRELHIEVHDDGPGFDPALAAGRGLGLRSMRQRAVSLGGAMSIDSAPGEGTTLRISVPLQREYFGTRSSNHGFVVERRAAEPDETYGR